MLPTAMRFLEENAQLSILRIRELPTQHEGLPSHNVSDLKKADAEAKDARSAMRAMKEELRQVRDIVAGKPFMLRRKFTETKYAQLG